MSSASSSSDDDSSNSEAIETLVEGRAKRATAANRYNREQIVAEETQDPEDEIALLFEEQEAEEDEEFEESVDEEENLSSSDDDDQGPNAAADDLDGEQALQREEKAKRSLKRKAALALTTTAGLRKKVRIDSRVPSRVSAPKPTKKKERTFLVNENEVVRTSKRAQTQANTETVKAKLVEDEKLRIKHKAKRDKLSRQKELEKENDEMTQEERLAEAAKIERRNAKSYNRWESKEKERAEEQAAKLAAMRNRKLDGPVIGYWSGVARWTGPRSAVEEVTDTSNEVAAAPKKRGRKSKIELEEMAARQRLVESNATSQLSAVGVQPESQTSLLAPTQQIQQPEAQVDVLPVVVSNDSTSNQMLEGIRDYVSEHENTPQASTPQEAIEATDMEAEVGDSTQMTNGEESKEPMEIDDHHGSEQQEQVDKLGTAPTKTTINETDGREESVKQPEVEEITTPPVVELATRNLVGLGNFDELSVKDRNRYSLFFNKRANKVPKNPKMQAPELCLITGQVARYRDPSTGIVYANSFAYRKIQQLTRHEYVWSSMLGCYVGKVGQVARGVPPGFLG